MNPRTLIGGVVFIGVLGFVFYSKTQNRAEAGTEVRGAIMSWVEALPCYQDAPEKLEAMCDAAHQQAFDSAYSMGGRRRSASLDSEKYVTEFFDALIRDAEVRNMTEAVAQLRECQAQCEAQVRAG